MTNKLPKTENRDSACNVPDTEVSLVTEQASCDEPLTASANDSGVSEDDAAVSKNRARKRRNRLISDALIVLFLLIFLFCLYKISAYYIASSRYQKKQKKVTAAIGGGIADDLVSEDTEALRENHDILVFPDEIRHELIGYVSHFRDEVSDLWKDKYAYLTSQNPDCFGYIEVPGTILSLPVMFTPENYEHYLYRNFEDKYEQRGLPFMDKNTVIGKSQNYLIYGHNMNDGTNFGTLRDYRKKEYYEEHPYVYFNTSVSEGIYQVMYICRTQIYGVNDDVFKYYNYSGPLTESQFNYYVSEMAKLSLYSTGVTAQWGDELLSLSTCDRYVQDGRLVIVCKRIH